MIALAIAAALAATPAPGCGLDHLEACANTNQLVWDRDFQRAVKRFVGPGRADYLYAGGRLADQAIDVLGGPPDEPTRLAGGLWLFTACRAHSCPEMGAVVLDGRGAIIALGIVNFHCRRGGCDEDAGLDLFQRARDPRTDSARAAIVDWARRHGRVKGAPILHPAMARG